MGNPNPVYDQVKKLKNSDFKTLIDGAVCESEIDGLRGKFVEFCRVNGWRFKDWLVAWSEFVADMPVEGGDDEISS